MDLRIRPDTTNMFRQILFWTHLVLGISAGAFIFIMSISGVLLAFETQITNWVDRDLRFVSVPKGSKPLPIANLMEVVRRTAGVAPSSITVGNSPQAATQFAIGRGKTIYVDQYSGAIVGTSSAAPRNFFAAVERWHRTLGAPLGSKGVGHWLTGISNLLFAVLIPLGVVLWLPRRWNWKAIRAAIAFRSGLSGRARDWNWHNVLGIWCAVPLLVIALTGVVMSFPWANNLLFRLSGSNPPVRGRGPGDGPPNRQEHGTGVEPEYDRLLNISKTLNPSWRTITLNVVHDANSPVQITVNTGTGAQPQKRTQYVLDGNTGAVKKTTTFSDGSLGQRLRTFVRFGHTGEWGGLAGQTVAAIASLAACFLVFTGISLSIRRLIGRLRRGHATSSPRVLDPEQALAKTGV
jgi:uncharacterized iron-regulated membrane protein